MRVAAALAAVVHLDTTSADWERLRAETQLYSSNYRVVAADDTVLAGMTTPDYADALRTSSDYMTLASSAADGLGGAAFNMSNHPGLGLVALSGALDNFSRASDRADAALRSADELWSEKGYSACTGD